jgi:hypothetical protein
MSEERCHFDFSLRSASRPTYARRPLLWSIVAIELLSRAAGLQAGQNIGKSQIANRKSKIP